MDGIGRRKMFSSINKQKSETSNSNAQIYRAG